MNANEFQDKVQEIVYNNVNLEYASLGYKAKIARAISFMENQLMNLIRNGDPNDRYDVYSWFSLVSIDYDPQVIKYGDEAPELVMTRYENQKVIKYLIELVESISPETLEKFREKEKFDNFDHYTDLTRMSPSSTLERLYQDLIDKKAGKETSIEGMLRYQRASHERFANWFPEGPEDIPPELDFVPVKETEISPEAKEQVHALVTDLDAKPWTFEAAENLYLTLYNLYREAGYSKNDDDTEYNRRKETEELYEELCLEWKKPFIVLPDLFYDIRKYTFKHIMGYRLSTIYENCFNYTERYRTPENAWLWESVDKAWELQDSYHDTNVGKTEFGSFGTMVISYYLFEPYLALLKFRCNSISDVQIKDREVRDFINYQFNGYPKETFMGYPQMYRDICGYIGITPQNMTELERKEKELLYVHTMAAERRENAKKRNDWKRADTANCCFSLVYTYFNEDVEGFVRACNALQPVLVEAEKISLVLEKERKQLYDKLLQLTRTASPKANAEQVALTLMQIYVNITLIHTKRSRTDVVDTYDFFSDEEIQEKFTQIQMNADQKNVFDLIRALLPPADDMMVKIRLLELEGRLEKIKEYYPDWSYEAHNSLWNEIDYLRSFLDSPTENRPDGTLTYLTMNDDREQYWGRIAQTIYEQYCKRLGILPLDFRYKLPKYLFQY